MAKIRTTKSMYSTF